MHSYARRQQLALHWPHNLPRQVGALVLGGAVQDDIGACAAPRGNGCAMLLVPRAAAKMITARRNSAIRLAARLSALRGTRSANVRGPRASAIVQTRARAMTARPYAVLGACETWLRLLPAAPRHKFAQARRCAYACDRAPRTDTVRAQPPPMARPQNLHRIPTKR